MARVIFLSCPLAAPAVAASPIPEPQSEPLVEAPALADQPAPSAEPVAEAASPEPVPAEPAPEPSPAAGQPDETVAPTPELPSAESAAAVAT